MENKTDFDRIGVNTLFCQQKNGRWVFQYGAMFYDMAPAGITEYALSPMIVGVDRLIQTGCNYKQISNPENGFLLLFSENYFPLADVKLQFVEPKFDGWVYRIEEMNFHGIMPGQCAWVCPYLGMYFSKNPETLYLKIEAQNAN